MTKPDERLGRLLTDPKAYAQWWDLQDALAIARRDSPLARELEKAVDDAPHPVELPQDSAREARCVLPGRTLIGQHFDLQRQGIQGIPQIVRDPTRECLELVAALFEHTGVLANEGRTPLQQAQNEGGRDQRDHQTGRAQAHGHAHRATTDVEYPRRDFPGLVRVPLLEAIDRVLGRGEPRLQRLTQLHRGLAL